MSSSTNILLTKYLNASTFLSCVSFCCSNSFCCFVDESVIENPKKTKKDKLTLTEIKPKREQTEKQKQAFANARKILLENNERKKQEKLEIEQARQQIKEKAKLVKEKKVKKIEKKLSKVEKELSDESSVETEVIVKKKKKTKVIYVDDDDNEIERKREPVINIYNGTAKEPVAKPAPKKPNGVFL